MRSEDPEMIANTRLFERMEAAINKFQPFKAPGPNGLYPVLLQAVVPIFVKHGGGIICNFTPILPYFQHWGG